jgi:hypothetical protein
VRGATLPAEFAYAVELLGDVGGHTISAYRRFVDTFVAQNDRLPEQIAMGKPMTPDLTVTFSTPDEMVEAIRAELRRVAGVFGRRPRPDGSRTGQPATRQPCPTPPPPRASHVANANTNGNGNAIQLGQHGIDGLIRDQGWRRVPSAARNSLSGPAADGPPSGREGGTAEGGEYGRVVFEAPVLMVDAGVPGLVEPDDAGQAGRTGPAEQVRDFARARDPAHRGLRDQDRGTGERADLGDRGAEHGN